MNNLTKLKKLLKINLRNIMMKKVILNGMRKVVAVAALMKILRNQRKNHHRIRWKKMYGVIKKNKM